MLKVKIPKNGQSEIQYTLYCLLEEFLGISYEVIIDKSNLSDFVFEVNEKSLIIKNHFFETDDPQILFHKNNIPQQVETGLLKLKRESYPITSIFGVIKVEETNESIILHSDIISSSFFMLSRWEECSSTIRDHMDRFPASASLAQKCQFLERPVVNEYVEILWYLLQKIGVTQTRKVHEFKIIPTHDVDRPYLWWSFLGAGFNLIKTLLEGRFKDFIIQFPYFLKGKDPYDTHELFMDLSEKKGVQSYFFFLIGGEHKYDGDYDINHPRILNLIKSIKDRGHKIGIHPSFYSYNNPVIIKNEKEELEKATGFSIDTGRQHYLRFNTPLTWRIWNDLDMKWDTTMTYADGVGFRCGVCYPFPVYDIVERKQLALYERPTIVMEGSLVNYAKLSPEDAKDKINELKMEVKKYNGEFVFLWHNSFFNTKKYKPYRMLLEILYDI